MFPVKTPFLALAPASAAGVAIPREVLVLEGLVVLFVLYLVVQRFRRPRG